MTYQTFDPTALSQPDLHAYLLAAIGPRPIAFASTVDREGRRNLAPFSFFNVFSSNPPIVVFSPARSGRDNTTKHTLDNVLEVPEVVINIVNYALVEQMSLASTAYPKGVDEFIKAGLKPIASQTIRPARVAEAPVALECSVEEVKALGDGPGAGNLIIARVLRIHIQKDYLDADGSLDSSKLDLVARMGGSWYCRAWGDALFEIPKPIRTQGIGVDQLPLSIRQSSVLTGNNLGRLGNVERLPTADELAVVATWPEVVHIQQAEASPADQHEQLKATRQQNLHRLAQTWLENGKTWQALQLLMWADTQE